MSTEIEPPDQLLSRIREGLDKLLLSEEQKAAVAPRLLENLRFLDSRGGKTPGGYLREDSSVFDFETKIRGVVERFTDDGLTTKDYLQAAVRQPQLFTQLPDTISKHIELVFDLYDKDVFTLPRVVDPKYWTTRPGGIC